MMNIKIVAKILVLSIIVFAHNEEKYIGLTLAQVENAIQKVGSKNFEVIVIDDGSSDETFNEINKYSTNFSAFKTKRNSVKSGILFCIKEGLEIAKGDKILCIPGHYMFDSTEICKVLLAAQNYDVVIGFRENKRHERPLPKLIASWALLNLFRIFVNSNMIDIHGLNVFPKSILLQAINTQNGHGNHIIPLGISLNLGLTQAHIPVKIRIGHKKRVGRGIRTELPSFRGAFSVLKQVFIARKILR